MRKYIVETAVAPGATGDCISSEWRVRAAVAELRRQGLVVQLMRAIRMPEEGRCLFVVSAPSSREAALAAERARLDGVRVVSVA